MAIEYIYVKKWGECKKGLKGIKTRIKGLIHSNGVCLKRQSAMTDNKIDWLYTYYVQSFSGKIFNKKSFQSR